MAIVKIGDQFVSVPDSIKSLEKVTSHNTEQLEARTLDEVEVNKLVEIQKIETPFNPNHFIAGPAAIEVLGKAAKSNKKLPRIIFYLLIAVGPGSCMHIFAYEVAKNNKMGWFWVLVSSALFLWCAIKILLVTFERHPKSAKK